MKLKKSLAALLAATIAVSPAVADEGMWLLPFLKQQNSEQLKKAGLLVDIDDIYNPDSTSMKDAVVIFGGGCTGEIISPEGLILTNHHCGYDAIQQHCTVELDYLTDGFWAMEKKDELPTPGLQVRFIEKIEEVTDSINKAVEESGNEMNAFSTLFLNKQARKMAGEEFLAENPFAEVVIKPFYGGNRYFMFTITVYNDVRMVGAPPSSIGKFGADTDNWMWPRHTGDFSLFRIYADKNGKPAEYSKDNVPLQVKKHLKISLAGVQEGDFTFVMGFPGRNWRYMIADEVEERMQTTNFMRQHVRGARQKVLMEQMLKDPAVRIHYASKYASSANYWKNAIGMNEGLIRLNVLDTKRAQQEELLARGREKGDDSYQKAFDEIRSIVSHRRDALYHQQAINEALVTALDFMRIPSTTELVTALKSKDKEQIKEAKLKLKKEGDKYFASVPFPDVERMVAKEMLKTYANYIPADQRINIFETINSRFK